MAGLVFIFGFWTLAGACQRHGAGGFVVLFTIIIFSLSHIRRLTCHSLHRAPLVGRPDFFGAGGCLLIWHGEGGFKTNRPPAL